MAEDGSNIPFAGFSENLVDANTGAAKEFSIPIPEDYADTSLAGKSCDFSVTVNEIKEQKLPDLDDEFAKGVGNGYENFEALKISIQEDLIEQSKRATQQAFQSKSLEEVLKGVSVELSDLTVKREIDHLLDERFQDRQGRRIDMDAYLRDAGKTQEELQDELRPAAIERLTRFLVLRKLAKDEGIEVASEDVDAEIENISSRSADSKEAMKTALSSENARTSLSTAIMNRKVLERLAEIVSGEAVADDSETQGTETEEASEDTISGAAPDSESSEEESDREETPATTENITSDEPKDKGGNPSDN
jgi:trigger factor